MTGISIRFWGVGGSMPARASRRHVFGVQTCCFEIRAGHQRLIIDAGTGIADLGHSLADDGATALEILLTHCHWDHIFGLTGFSPIFTSGQKINLRFATLSGESPEDVLDALFKPPYFPLAPGDLRSTISLQTIAPAIPFTLDALTVRPIALNHPNGASGFRIDSSDAAIAIITDHEHGVRAIDDEIIKLCANVDLLIYDAMWDGDVDYQAHRGWGHSTWQAGLDILRRAGGKRLVCVHHDPRLSDEDLSARERRLKSEHPDSLFAREGMTLTT